MSRTTVVIIKMQTDSYNEIELRIPNGLLKDWLKIKDRGFNLCVVYTDKTALEFLKIVETECGIGTNTMTNQLLMLAKAECDKHIADQAKEIQKDLQNIVDAKIKNLDDVDSLRQLIDSYDPSSHFINIEAKMMK